jgi:MarR family transcriptional regulator, organic hydroperoxide resistance regulator
MNDSDYEKIVSRTTLDPPTVQTMPSDTRVSLESNIITLLHQISHHGRQMFIEGLGRDKLSLSHWMILDELDNTTGKTMRELTEILAVPPSSVTGLVDTLVERHTLERISDPEDRRIVRVKLTQNGLEYVTTIRTHLMNQYRISMNDMNQTELQLLERMYQSILGRMLEYRQNKS